MKYLKNLEIVNAMVWGITLLAVTFMSSTGFYEEYIWLAMTFAASFQINYLANSLRKKDKKISKC